MQAFLSIFNQKESHPFFIKTQDNRFTVKLTPLVGY